MSELSRQKKQKKPGGGKAALKQGGAIKYLNEAKPVWVKTPYLVGWSGWFPNSDSDTCPFDYIGMLMRAYEKTLTGFDPRGAADSWMPFLKTRRNAGRGLVQINSDWAREGVHYHLSGLIEWFGYSVYAFVWKQTELGTRGTELTFPHRQRIEDSDANRFRIADKAAAAAELEWTKRFP